MKPYYHDEHITLYQGDAKETLKQLPEQSIDCIVTSPPYYGLRDYNTDEQIGLETVRKLFQLHSPAVTVTVNSTEKTSEKEILEVVETSRHSGCQLSAKQFIVLRIISLIQCFIPRDAMIAVQ